MKKKNLKKILIGCIAVGLVVLAIIIIVKFSKPEGNNKLPIWDTKPVNTQVNLEEIFEEIEKIEGMSTRSDFQEMNESGEIPHHPEDEETENKNSQQTKPEDEIDFGKYESLEMKAIVNTTDNAVNEVWMIKLGNLNQQEEVCRIFGRRIQKLKNAFREDEVQTRILNEAVIKQEDGIVIMIISPNDNEIEKTIGNIMSEK